MKRIIAIILIFFLLITTFSVYAQNEYTNLKAKVVESIKIEEKEENGKTKKVQQLNIRMLEGDYEQEEYEMEYVLSEDIEQPNIKPQLQKNDLILVNISENEGEISNIDFQELINYHYEIYIIVIVLIALALIFKKNKVTIPVISLLLSIAVIYFIFVMNISKNINLIILAAITSIIIVLLTSIISNGINKKTFIMVLFNLIGIVLNTGIIYILVSIIGLSGNLWCGGIVKEYINIKDLILSIGIISSSILCVPISNIVIMLNADANKLFYKVKSDNIIDGQRSLKL